MREKQVLLIVNPRFGSDFQESLDSWEHMLREMTKAGTMNLVQWSRTSWSTDFYSDPEAPGMETRDLVVIVATDGTEDMEPIEYPFSNDTVIREATIDLPDTAFRKLVCSAIKESHDRDRSKVP